MSFSRGVTAPPLGSIRQSPQPSDFLAPESRQQSPAQPEDDDRQKTPDQVSDHPDQNDDDPDEDDDDLQGPNLATSLNLLAKNIAGMSKADKPTSIKPRAPDTFDGSDPSKLDTFVFQITMYIAARSKDFPDDDSRVTFALSYLKSTPLDWFQTEINHSMTTGGKFPNWFTSFPEFLEELRRLFGPRDPVNDAVNALEALRYKDSSKATRYNLEFNRHSRRTGWNELALARHYYKGLPDRLKDEIARIGKPAGLIGLQDLVSTLDQRYWERQSEIKRDNKSANANPQKSSDKSNNNRSNTSQAGDSKSNGQNQQSKNKDSKTPAAKPAASSSSKDGTKANSIADVLGPDGKLKPEERKRRMEGRLCLRCGEAGHIVSACTRTSKPKPKARAATTASTSTATPATTPASGKA